MARKSSSRNLIQSKNRHRNTTHEKSSRKHVARARRHVKNRPYMLTNKSTPVILEAIHIFIKYISDNINLLNNYILLMKKVTSLNYERTCLIKFVKKLRFYNETLRNSHLFNMESEEDREEKEDELNFKFENVDIINRVILLNSIFIKNLETLDLLNFQLTRSLQNEIWMKTLNEKLLIPEKNVAMIEDVYNHYIKFIQWLSETIGMHDSTGQLEVITQTIRYAQEDPSQPFPNSIHDEVETENIFLQTVIPSKNEEEYIQTLKEWLNILTAKNQQFQANFEDITSIWNGLLKTYPVKR
ncbi:hypothetical protein TPHA_0G02410 [Tetrapisispora phaffii CBS 4417]|uniref:RNA binding protein She2 domain-containing protein n=1 Tax=Tetrapisispora phaffii (strain ATCC 24235 / CBS 4417 / NBRC 1672 / NRRL Y-8282 / UCD 70-5) TaxID=1071381 RepID=G8BVZ8_TETPH|nr:hypothetical protein TPHA_0G02410 [Tetrapisispora phaffii CBS 4417]CCE64076.1 hypothetical protein TPHA_0G02410 [Tetrapisispora phaffii CBS 4417]